MTRRKIALLGIALFLAVGSAVAAEGTWERIGDDDGIVVWRKDIEGSPVVAFKGDGVIDAPIAKVMGVLADTSRKTEWVARCVEAKDVRNISDFERVEYNRTSAPWPIADRDFLFHAKVEGDRAQKKLVLTLRSIEDPLCPKNEDVAVRGVLNTSTYTLVSIEGGKKTRLTVEIHADPKGSIPKWVVNLFQKSWPHKTIEGIREQAAKPDVAELALVKRFFDGTLTSTTAAVTTVAPAGKSGRTD